MGNCFYCSKAEPVVQTKAGKIRGFKMNSTYTFHGIKYADADRFQMPREVKPWKGIKNALAYGYAKYIVSLTNSSDTVCTNLSLTDSREQSHQA